jgi:DNA-binding NarL/FixJ family response regulator
MSLSVINRHRDITPLRILLIAGSMASGALIETELESAGITVMVALPASEAEFIQTVTTLAPVAILVDAAFEAVPPSHALGVLRNAGSSTPLIVVAESIDEVRAVEWLRAGAENLVVWTNLTRLPSAIRDALSIREPLTRLSPRQREVMRLVALGLTMREIAERLGVSVKTVETHRSAVAKRLGIRDVARLVRYAVRVGMVA